ncbi:MAG: LysE family translocator [Flavobacteriaceae bacterium]
MLDLGLIATIGFIHLVALISPGPDFVVACRNTLLYSRTIGIYTAIGFGLGILVHISYAVFGLSWLIANHAFVFAIIQYMGAAYLIYIGILSLRDFESKVESNTTASPHSMAAVKAVRMGFITNVLNPKATLFFLSLFSSMLTPAVSNSSLIALSILLVGSTMLWFSIVALLISHPRFTVVLKRYEKTVQQFFGVLLIGIGDFIVVASLIDM